MNFMHCMECAEGAQLAISKAQTVMTKLWNVEDGLARKVCVRTSMRAWKLWQKKITAMKLPMQWNWPRRFPGRHSHGRWFCFSSFGKLAAGLGSISSWRETLYLPHCVRLAIGPVRKTWKGWPPHSFPDVFSFTKTDSRVSLTISSRLSLWVLLLSKTSGCVAVADPVQGLG